MKTLKECRILVTPTSYGRYNPELRTILDAAVAEVIYNTTGKPLSSEQVNKMLPGIDGYIAGLDQIDSTALASADKLKIIARYGVGIDGVDIIAAKEKGIIVTNTPGANSGAVAEIALTMMIMLARKIPQATQELRKGSWPRVNGISLEGKTVGILGLGAIGKQLALRLAGFDCHIIAYDPYADSEFAREHDIQLVDHENLITSSDFISLHLPLLDSTRSLVDVSFFQKMKDGACLINTSRGEIIDEKALISALQSEKLGGAGLDAFDKEPPDIANPLLSMPNVVCTPHLGAHADSATNTMGKMAMEECLAVLDGKKTRYQVN
jgi:D-3-phosphoglycerate dehydrogenase